MDVRPNTNARSTTSASHPDRNAQFQYINRRVRAFLRAGDPVISIDTNYDPSGIMDRPGAAVGGA
jgi:hypothetical protein